MTPVSPRGRRLALLAALLGWMFDGMEMGLFPLVGRDALRELLHDSASTDNVNKWYGLVMACFLVGAATGGVVFGWLGDKIGRVRAMTVSVLLYSLCSGLSAASSTPAELAVLRFMGALGMGGEWALGVALVMESWEPEATPGAHHRDYRGSLATFASPPPLSLPIVTSTSVVAAVRPAPRPAATSVHVFPNSGVRTALNGYPLTNVSSV